MTPRVLGATPVQLSTLRSPGFRSEMTPSEARFSPSTASEISSLSSFWSPGSGSPGSSAPLILHHHLPSDQSHIQILAIV